MISQHLLCICEHSKPDWSKPIWYRQMSQSGSAPTPRCSEKWTNSSPRFRLLCSVIRPSWIRNRTGSSFKRIFSVNCSQFCLLQVLTVELYVDPIRPGMNMKDYWFLFQNYLLCELFLVLKLFAFSIAFSWTVQKGLRPLWSEPNWSSFDLLENQRGVCLIQCGLGLPDFILIYAPSEPKSAFFAPL